MAAAAPRDESEMRRLAEAGAWRARLSEEGAESSSAFEAWLTADPGNAAAWAKVQSGWLAVGEAAASPELMAARRNALDRARRQSHRRGRVGPAAAVMAASLLLTIGIGGVLVATGQISSPQHYETARGERRVITLADGSRVSLDSGTSIRIGYTKAARKLELLSGQARFDVAHDVGRPFSVKARDQTVVATGTAFNIDLAGPKVLITLIEGHVTILHAPSRAGLLGAVAPQRSASPSVVLNPGQELIAAPAAAARVEVASLDRITAWQAGQLIFEDEPLASVAERVSRYAPQPLAVDASVANLRISGVFNAGDVGSFVDTVSRYLPVEASEDPNGKVVLRRRK